jgi:hypothetical protein
LSRDPVRTSISVGTPVSTGAVVSTTFAVNLTLFVLPLAGSFTVHFTVVVPSANSLPDAGEQTERTERPLASLITGAAYETRAPAELVASTVTLATRDELDRAAAATNASRSASPTVVAATRGLCGRR